MLTTNIILHEIYDFSILNLNQLSLQKKYITMEQNNVNIGPIGVFDSGYGGLTILNAIREKLPQYDYLYLGDNARAPYGPRSFNIVYRFTLEAVKYLFEHGCNLVILACNTASAKALRTIQQNDLPKIDTHKRVLGVIRPTVEKIGEISQSGNIGILGTSGTIQSKSYDMEISKLYPSFNVYSQSCPLWVPLVENLEANEDGADYFVKKYINELLSLNNNIDSVILGCTHYPLLINKIRQYMPKDIQIIEQGGIVADSLSSYLQRHIEIENKCSKNGTCTYLTTEDEDKFNGMASVFLKEQIKSKHINL